MKNKDTLITFALLAAGFIIWVMGCTPPVPSSSNNRAVRSATNASNNANASQGEVASSNWSYAEDADKMGRGTIKKAVTFSTNTVSFDSPYQGEQRGMLGLRVHPEYGKDVILSIDRGQFLCNFTGCKVLVRFDSDKPVSFSANEPADNSTTTIFLDGYSNFVARLKRSKKVMIEAPFYQEGTRIFEFNVEGLEWEDTGSRKGKK